MLVARLWVFIGGRWPRRSVSRGGVLIASRVDLCAGLGGRTRTRRACVAAARLCCAVRCCPEARPAWRSGGQRPLRLARLRRHADPAGWAGDLASAGSLVASTLFLSAFVILERRQPAPLLPLWLPFDRVPCHRRVHQSLRSRRGDLKDRSHGFASACTAVVRAAAWQR
jgi:hypothetical protein